MSRTYMKDLEKATKIMNNTIHELYAIKDLSSYQIIYLLEQYANNEKQQIKMDLKGID